MPFAPYEHQVEALRRMEGRDEFALLMGMRTGKSKVTIDNWQQTTPIRQAAMTVVAPAGAYRVWETELQRHLDPEWLDRSLIRVWDSKIGKRSVSDLFETRDKTRPRILVANVEAFSTVDAVRHACAEVLQMHRDSTFAVDECFPAGSLVSTPSGSRAIETLRRGDEVYTSTGVTVIRRVFKKKSKIFIHVVLDCGTRITSTPNEPFFTDAGWVCAGNLTGRTLFREEEVRALRNAVPVEGSDEEVLRNILLSEVANGAPRDQIENVHSRNSRQESCHVQSERSLEGSTFLEQRAVVVQQDEEEDQRSAQENRAHVEDPRGERAPRSRAAEDASEGIRFALETGARHRIGREAVRLSNLLQSRLGRPAEEDCDRMRRQQSQLTEAAVGGCQERRQAEGTRVVRIETEEREDPADVFDLELEGCPHFFVESVLVHNSTTIKNDSKRQRTIRILRKMAGRARILSGMPTPRSPLDIWHQFEFLREGLLGFTSYKAFEQRYAIVRHMRVGGKYSIRVPVRYTDKIEELWEKLSPHSFRVRLEDCADVPPKLYVTREVELTPRQQELYDEMEATATATLGGDLYMTSQQSVTTSLRLHQLCCGWATDDLGGVHAVPENRTRALVNLLDDYDGKAIVWCSYGRDLEKVAAALTREFGPQSTVTFWGQNRSTREDDSARFKTDPECRFIVATPGSGGRGRDWSEANLIVYYSNTDNLEHRDQSEERASHAQKRDRVTVVDFATRGTIEWKIIYAMRRKIDLATVVVGDPPREWVV